MLVVFVPTVFDTVCDDGVYYSLELPGTGSHF